MRFVSILLCAIAVLTGCTGETAPEPMALPAPVDTPPVTANATFKPDIGTVEAHVYIEARLDTSALPEHVKAEEMVDRRYRVSLVSVDVPAPVPAQLPVSVAVVVDEDFADSPFVARCTVYRGEEIIGEASKVAGGPGVYVLDGSPYDVLAGLETLPKDLLVHVTAEIFLLPEGMEPGTVDAAALEAPATGTSTLQSNPVRINFSGVHEGLPKTMPLNPLTGLTAPAE